MLEKALNTVKFWKMMVIFEIPTIKLILNSIQTFAAGADECQVFFSQNSSV